MHLLLYITYDSSSLLIAFDGVSLMANGNYEVHNIMLKHDFFKNIFWKKVNSGADTDHVKVVISQGQKIGKLSIKSEKMA